MCPKKFQTHIHRQVLLVGSFLNDFFDKVGLLKFFFLHQKSFFQNMDMKKIRTGKKGKERKGKRKSINHVIQYSIHSVVASVEYTIPLVVFIRSSLDVFL